MAKAPIRKLITMQLQKGPGDPKQIALETDASVRYVNMIRKKFGLSNGIPRMPRGIIEKAIRKFEEQNGPIQRIDTQTMAAIARQIHTETGRWVSMETLGPAIYRMQKKTKKVNF